MQYPVRFRSTFAAAVVALACGAAHAAPTDFNLRVFNVETTNAAGGTTYGNDGFNDGNPYTGVRYDLPNGTSAAGGYSASTFGAGAEMTGAAADFLGQQYGLGGLQFRRGDASVVTNNLTPAGYASYALSETRSVVPGTALGLVRNTEAFDVFSAFDWRIPLAGESVVMALSGSGGFAYNGRVSLRFGTTLVTGQSYFSVETQSRAADGTVTRSVLASVLASDILADLSGVDYVVLELTRGVPSANDLNPQVRAQVGLLDAALAPGGEPVNLASYDFGAIAPFSFDRNGFDSPFVFAQWTDPITTTNGSVPEPGSAALAMLGLLAVWRSRRSVAAL